MKKSLIALLMGLILAFSLMGCTDSGDDNKKPETPVEPTPVVTKLSMSELQSYLSDVSAKQTETIDAIVADKGSASIAQTATAEVSVELGSGAASSKTGMEFTFSALTNVDAERTLESMSVDLGMNLGPIFGGEKDLGIYFTENKLYIKGDVGSDAEAVRKVIDFADLDSDVLTGWVGEVIGKLMEALPEFPGTGVAVAAEEETPSLTVITDALIKLGLSEADANECLSELAILVAGIDQNALLPITKTVLENDTTVQIKFEYSILSTLIDDIFELGAKYAAKIDPQVNEKAVEQWNTLTSTVGAFLPKGVSLTVTQSYRDDVLQKEELDFKLLLNVSKNLSLNDFTDLSAENIQNIISEQIAAYDSKNYNTCTIAVTAEAVETVGDPQDIVIENPEDYAEATEMIADAFDEYVLSQAESALNDAYAAVEKAIADGTAIPAIEEGDVEVVLTAPSDLAKLSAAQLEALTGADTFTYEISADETQLTFVTERSNVYGVTSSYSASLDFETGFVTTRVVVNVTQAC